MYTFLVNCSMFVIWTWDTFAYTVGVTMSTVYQNRYQHIRDVIERQGGQTAIAAKIGISKQLLSNMASANPSKPIGARMARKMEAGLGLPVGFMDSPLNSAREPDPGSEYVEVPVLDVTASMGPGAVMPWSEETMHMVRLSKNWIRRNLNATAFDRLAIISARGDSMEPTITSGAEVIVDTSITAIKTDGVFVLTRNGELYIKRIQRHIDGSVEMISDNNRYRPVVIQKPLAEGFLVLGMVLGVWNFTKM